MMKNPQTERQTDIIQGRVYRGRKWDIQAKKWVDAKFFNVAIYEIDAQGQPVQIGTVTLKNKEVVPKFKIAKVFRIAESSMLKVAAGDSSSCNLYYSVR